MEKLPEKYAIKVDENVHLVLQRLEEMNVKLAMSVKWANGSNVTSFPLPDLLKTALLKILFVDKYITFSHVLNLLQKDHILITSTEFLRLTDKKVELDEICGYEVPIDLPFWSLKKGEILPLRLKRNDFYFNSDLHLTQIDAKLVESWRPVYKKEIQEMEEMYKKLKLIFG